jgi:very-short-patch-repair endonuclease
VIVPDLLFVASKLIVEVDGYAFHSSRSAFEVDRTRQNLLVAAGYRVLRITWQRLLNDLDGVMAEIRAALAVVR